MFDRVLYCGRGITLVSLELREEYWWCSFKTFDVCDDEHVGQELADYLREFQDHFHGKAILLVAMDAQGDTWKPMGLKVTICWAISGVRSPTLYFFLLHSQANLYCTGCV